VIDNHLAGGDDGLLPRNRPLAEGLAVELLPGSRDSCGRGAASVGADGAHVEDVGSEDGFADGHGYLLAGYIHNVTCYALAVNGSRACFLFYLCGPHSSRFHRRSCAAFRPFQTFSTSPETTTVLSPLM